VVDDAGVVHMGKRVQELPHYAAGFILRVRPAREEVGQQVLPLQQIGDDVEFTLLLVVFPIFQQVRVGQLTKKTDLLLCAFPLRLLLDNLTSPLRAIGPVRGQPHSAAGAFAQSVAKLIPALEALFLGALGATLRSTAVA